MQVQAVFVLLASLFALGFAQGSDSVPATVSCKNAKGEVAQFNTADCHKVAAKLAQGSISKASCNSCTLAMVDPSAQKPFQFSQAVASKPVVDAVNKVLSSCGSQAHQKRAAPSGQHHRHEPVLILGKGDGTAC